jgi:2-dehydrotetronate isomerase
MPQFAANLSMLYQEHPFLDRFEAAAKDGFKAVEFLFPYSFDAHEIASRLKANGLQQVLFNAPPGGTNPAEFEAAWAKGERGVSSIPGRESELRGAFSYALKYAEILQCPRVHLIAGIPNASTDKSLAQKTYVENLRWAAREAAKQGLEVLIEPINTRDMPGFHLNRQDHAHATIAEAGEANLKVQFDLYHCQVVEGDVAMKIRQYLPTGQVGHFQIAGVPERHEPNIGEMNYPYLFDLIDGLGYQGWIGCEYRPRLGTQAGATSLGLDWLNRREVLAGDNSQSKG